LNAHPALIVTICMARCDCHSSFAQSSPNWRSSADQRLQANAALVHRQTPASEYPRRPIPLMEMNLPLRSLSQSFSQHVLGLLHLSVAQSLQGTLPHGAPNAKVWSRLLSHMGYAKNEAARDRSIIPGMPCWRCVGRSFQCRVVNELQPAAALRHLHSHIIWIIVLSAWFTELAIAMLPFPDFLGSLLIHVAPETKYMNNCRSSIGRELMEWCKVSRSMSWMPCKKHVVQQLSLFGLCLL
jgi:hypothetical protein